MQDTDMTSSEEPAGTLLPVESLLAASSSSSSSGTTAELSSSAQSPSTQSSMQAAAVAVPSSANTSLSSSSCKTAPPLSVPIPRFLQQLFEREEQRRKLSVTTGPPQVGHQQQQQSNGIKTNTMTGDGLVATPLAIVPSSIALPADLCITSPINGSTSQLPGLAYSASSAASSDTSSFPADMTDTDAHSAASTSSIKSASVTPSNAYSHHQQHQAAMSLPALNQYQTRPAAGAPDYASSASSTAGDETYAVQSEAGSVASRSTSPAARSIGGFSTSTSGTNYTYSSPSTSPFFHHQAYNGGLYSHVSQHGGQQIHQSLHSGPGQNGHLHLQPLTLPPPSLDLPGSSSNTSASTTPSCDTLSAFTGFKHSVSPLGWQIPTASTSQNSIPGVISPESSFLPGRTQRPRHHPQHHPQHQHYSPLHPFHQQGFLSPQRSRSLHTPRDLLGPDLCDAVSEHEPLLRPPDNFAMVSPGVYRSSFPSSKNFEFLKTLGLKTVLTLVQEEEYPQSNKDFFKREKIRFLQIGIPGNKVSFFQLTAM